MCVTMNLSVLINKLDAALDIIAGGGLDIIAGGSVKYTPEQIGCLRTTLDAAFHYLCDLHALRAR